MSVLKLLGVTFIVFMNSISTGTNYGYIITASRQRNVLGFQKEGTCSYWKSHREIRIHDLFIVSKYKSESLAISYSWRSCQFLHLHSHLVIKNCGNPAQKKTNFLTAHGEGVSCTFSHLCLKENTTPMITKEHY